MAEKAHQHRWYWRRKRNATRGFWECPGCGATSGWIGLDKSGHALQGPPEAGDTEAGTGE